MTGSPADGLIRAAELAGLLNTGPRPALLDIRWRLGGPPGRGLYATGHLPGAVFVDLDTDLAAPPGAGGRHPLPSAAGFQAAMRRSGVSGSRTVVVYDDADSTAAARAWWLLRYFGHPAVRVLDGGYRAWQEAGYPVETGDDPGAAPGDFTASPGHLPLLDAEGAARLARGGLLLDARAAKRYRGETEPVDPVAGHIPGAVSAPTAQNVNADGTFRPAAELAARFQSLGARPADTRAPGAPAADTRAPGARPAGARAAHTRAPGARAVGAPAVGARAADEGTGPDVGAYCGSGVTAAHEVLALTLAGIPAALYAGSWSEWITDPARPVATGPNP